MDISQAKEWENTSASELLTLMQQNEVVSEVSEEFSLPDYVPEIRRILTVRAQVLPESKYINNTTSTPSLEFGGNVTYSVIYTDDEGKLCALPLSSAYEKSTQLQDTPDITEISTRAESVSPRVSAPRKISIKSRLKSKVLAYKKQDASPQIIPNSSAEQIYLQKREENINTLDLTPISLGDIRISDRLDGVPEGMRPIWCDASICLNDIKVQKGSVLARGEVNVKCLLSGDGTESVIYKTMPLVEEIEAEGAELGDMARVNSRCVSLSISNEEQGSSNALFFDLTCELEGALMKNKEVQIVKDAYSTKNESTPTYRELEYQSAQKAQHTSFTVSESQKRANREIEEIITTLCDPVYEKYEIKGSRAQLLGSLKVSLIGKKSNAEQGLVEYSSDQYEIPIKFEAELGNIDGKITPICDFSLGNINTRYDNESFYITCEVIASYSVYKNEKVRVLESLEIDKEREVKNDSSVVRVCFPAEGEELWDIAKKYHTTTAKLAEQNDLIDDAQFNKKCIII